MINASMKPKVYIVWMWDSNEGSWYEQGRFSSVQRARVFMTKEKAKISFRFLLTELLDEV